MFRPIIKFLNSFFGLFINRASTVRNEPVNKVSLIVIILIDIFILVQVFTGINDISNWHLSPIQAHPCYQEWRNYQSGDFKDKKYFFIKDAIFNDSSLRTSLKKEYLEMETNHLGKVSELCLADAELKDAANNKINKGLVAKIDKNFQKSQGYSNENEKIKAQYDSTLLEKIANQPQNKSINLVNAEKAKEKLEQNSKEIAKIAEKNKNLTSELFKKPEIASFISFIDDKAKFNLIKTSFEQAEFWDPSIQIGLQSLFLLPLIAIALIIHNFGNRKGFGLVSLISWHLLVIFMIPLVLKIFEFLQIGIIFRFFFNIIEALFGRLLFLISYVYIFLIPLMGFLVIKFFQKITSNPKGKIITRVQKSQCIRCARKIRLNDQSCPYCGLEQYITCENCQTSTYKNLPFCRQCGHRHST